jgi:SAM-dependent methyltransferase
MKNQKVLADEARYADHCYSQWESNLEINPKMFRLYAEPKDESEPREAAARLLGPVAGKDLLDFGCGMGEEAVYFAALGARVTAIDISPKGIELTRRRAEHNGLQVNAFVADVLNSGLPAESFDVIHGLGILHHVGIQEGLSEIHRLLRPGGHAVFLEHMNNSALIERLRRWYNRSGEDYTDHEVPLRWDECVSSATALFGRNFAMRPYSLLWRLRRPLPFFRHRWAQTLDNLLLCWMPFLRRFAGGVIIYVGTSR